MNAQELFFKLNRIQRIAIVVAIAVLLQVVFYFLVVSDKLGYISALNQQINRLKMDIRNEENNLKQGPKLMAKIDGLKKKLQTMVAGLPEKQDIEELLQKISQLLSQTNLTTKRFVPGKEQINTELYYAKIPISLDIRGIYRRQGAFLAALNNLSRIVNVPNIRLSPDGNRSSTEKKLGLWPLNANVTANTYRRLSQEEIKRIQEQNKKAQKGRRGRGRRRGRR
jgi:type IV pilus assembly protein PilO